MNPLRDLYRASIIQHASNPVGYQAEILPTHSREEYNPQCGDRIEISLKVDGKRIEAAAFDGDACQICMASASMLCESLAGQETKETFRKARQLKDSLSDENREPPEGLEALIGVRPFPSRIRCATLPWEAAVNALEEN